MEDKITERIVIDEQAEILIQATFRQYRILAVLGSISTLASIIVELIRLPEFLRFKSVNWYDIFIFKVAPFLILLQTLFSLFILYFYFTGVKLQQRGLADMDQPAFSRSFRSYKNGNYLSIINCFILLLYFLVVLYHDLVK